MSELGLQVIRDFGDLEALRDEWMALLGRSATNEPMLSPSWLLTWSRIYGAGHQLTVGAFRDGGRLIGLAPLHRRRIWYRPGLPFRRLEFLGADVDEQDGVCSAYLTLLAERGAEERVVAAFGAAVAEGRFGSWDELLLPALAGDVAMTAHLAEAFQHKGFQVERKQTTTAAYVALPATWDDYLAGLPRKQRYGVVRTQRDFDEWAAGTAELHEARNPAELAEGKRVLTTLHNDRWQAAAAVGAFQRPRFTTFHDDILPQLLAQGALELLWLTVRGQPVAAVYNLIWENKVYGYQSGRKLDVPRPLRPGVVLVIQALRRAIAAGRREYDFLGGEAVYKQQLAQASRPLVRLRVARATLLEAAHRCAERGVDALRVLRRAGRRLFGQNKSKNPVVPSPSQSLDSKERAVLPRAANRLSHVKQS